MQRKQVSSISLLICFTVIFALITVLWAQPVEAKSSRVAKIEDIKGVVHIKKAGGSKEFRAYKNMTLNSGDHISTKAKSSLVLKIIDREDEVTIEEKSDLYISELRDALNGGKKTKFSIWGGSIWVKASSLLKSADQFEIETPTAIMGVRGTNLLVGVNPSSGESTFFIASGVGKVNKIGQKKIKNLDNSVLIYPSQQIVIHEGEDEHLDDNVNIVNLDTLVANTSDAIIGAIIKNKHAIDKENEEYIEKLKDDNTSQEVINRITANLDNFVGNIVKTAIDKEKVDKDQINKLINEVNKEMDKKIDLNNVKPLELSDAEKEKQAQIKLLEEERKKKQEEEKKKQEELKKQNETLLQKLKEQLEKQKENKKKAEEDAKKKAAEEFVRKLADDAALAVFKAKEKEIEAQKKAQDDHVKKPKVIATPAAEEEEAEEEPTIISISALKDTVDMNAEYPLPNSVAANMSDGTMQSVNIYWSSSTTNTSVPGTYTFTGTISEYGSVTLTLIVLEPTIVTIANISDTADFGSSYTFPTQVLATMSAGEPKLVNVTWANPTVVASEPGFSTYYGTVDGYGEIELILEVLPDISLALNSSIYYLHEVGALLDSIVVTMADYTANTDSLVIDSVTANVYSDSDTVGINVMLLETGISTGIFVGNLTMDRNDSYENDHVIQANHKDQLTVSYNLLASHASVVDKTALTVAFNPLDGASLLLPNDSITLTFSDHVYLSNGSQLTNENVKLFIALEQAGIGIDFDAIVDHEGTSSTVTVTLPGGFLAGSIYNVAISNATIGDYNDVKIIDEYFNTIYGSTTAAFEILQTLL